MSTTMTSKVDPYGTALKRCFDQDRAKEFYHVVRRAQQDNPKPDDLEALRRWLADYPGPWHGVFDLAKFLQANLMHRMLPGEAARISLEPNLSAMRDELGYVGAPALERLLIENVMIAWLRHQWLECQMVVLMGDEESRMTTVAFLERRLSASHHRYLMACQALARVRALASKNRLLQLNIATQNAQQLNVGGDLLKLD